MSEALDKTVSKTPEPYVTGDENNTIDIVVPNKVSHSGFNPSEPIPLQECPLANCARQCRTKADMQVHLAMTHYKDELEKDYITDCEQCKVCDKILPGNKEGCLKHMAVEHNVVIDYVERDMAIAVLNKAVDDLG